MPVVKLTTSTKPQNKFLVENFTGIPPLLTSYFFTTVDSTASHINKIAVHTNVLRQVVSRSLSFQISTAVNLANLVYAASTPLYVRDNAVTSSKDRRDSIVPVNNFLYNGRQSYIFTPSGT